MMRMRVKTRENVDAALKDARLSREQVEVLEKAYSESSKPNRSCRKQLIKDFPVLANVDRQRIKIWFKSRRARARKEATELHSNSKKPTAVNETLKEEQNGRKDRIQVLTIESWYMQQKMKWYMQQKMERRRVASGKDVITARKRKCALKRANAGDDGLLTLAEETLASFLAKAMGIAIDWVPIPGMEHGPDSPGGFSSIARNCSGVAARSFGHVKLDASTIAKSLKDRASWFQDFRSTKIFSTININNGGIIELIDTQIYAPTTLARARYFRTLRYTKTLENESLVVCERSLPGSWTGPDAHEGMPQQFVRAEILPSGYLIQPREGKRSFIYIVDHIDFEGRDVPEVLKSLYESSEVASQRMTIAALRYVKQLAQEATINVASEPSLGPPVLRPYMQKLSRGFDDAINGFNDATGDVMITVSSHQPLGSILCAKTHMLLKVDSVLDKENFTLEELLDEEEIIQECKALNSRLINFLRDRDQIEQLLRYIVEDAAEGVDDKRTFKFPFVACEILTCEIDVILKTLVEEEELMDLLFSFLEPNRPHCALLAGYFSKVVICLMLRKTIPLMSYVQRHQDVLKQLVDLIGITSILEVLVRLVGADDYFYPNSMDVMQWLADSNLLEMIVDKLNHSSPTEVHANAAETLCAITRTAPSPLASKLSSPSFVSRIFGHALEDAHSKSGLVHSLSLCISLLDPRRSMPTPRMYSLRSQHVTESPIHVNPDTLGAMLPKLGDLLNLLNVSADENVLHTTYGELRPPLGKHRLKIVEFIAVLLKTGNDVAEKELISSGTIHRVFDLLFEYPFNNALHHQVESIICSCLESKNNTVDHLFNDCGLIGKIIQADKNPTLSGDGNQPTKPASAAKAPRVGYLGHLTRISNKLVQLANKDKRILAHLQENEEWNNWQANILQERNLVENVYRWGCGRPTALHDRMRDSDDEDPHDRDYDVAALANNLSQAFRYSIYDNNDAEQGQGTLDRDDVDVYFDDESAEVVISSLRLGDDQGSLFTNSNWFGYQETSTGDGLSTSFPIDGMEDIDLNGIREDKESAGQISTSGEEQLSQMEKIGTSGDLGMFQFESSDNDDLFGDRPIPEWAAWDEASDIQVDAASTNPFLDQNISNIHIVSSDEASDLEINAASTNPFLDHNFSDISIVGSDVATSTLPSDALGGESALTSASDSGSSSIASESSPKSPTGPSLFEDDVEFIGVEVEGTEKAMDQALKEGIVGEAGPMRRPSVPKETEMENRDDSGPQGRQEFNDKNFWKVEQEVAVSE